MATSMMTTRTVAMTTTTMTRVMNDEDDGNYDGRGRCATVVYWFNTNLLLWNVDSEIPWFESEWVPIFYEARSTA